MLTFSHLAHHVFPTGVYLGHSIVLPPGGNVHYVRSVGRVDGDPPDLAGRLHATVASALAQCRHDTADNVVVLANHAETLSGTDAWSDMKRTTRILGQGQGTLRPVFSFGAGATDQLLLNDANVVISNSIFTNSASAVNTTLAIDVSAAGNYFTGCKFVPSDYGAVAQKLTTMIRLSSGANGFRFRENVVLGGATTATTDIFLTNAAVDDCQIRDCYMFGKLGTTEGIITMATAAPTNFQLADCTLINGVTNSTVAAKGIASATGYVKNVLLGVTVADGAGVAAAAWNTKGNLIYDNVRAATVTLGSTLVVAATQ